MPEPAAAPTLARPCPICGKPGLRDYRPFCSARCAEQDLHRWFSEGYRVPGDPGSALDEDDPDGG